MFLEPWIGKNYQLGINNEKILILGESHYTDDGPFDNSQESSDFTTKVLESILKSQKKIRFFNYVGQLFNEDWTKIWEFVAFANLIQHVFENGEQPNQEQIKTITTFNSYLELLKPDKIIVVSSRAWNSWFKNHIDNNTGVESIKEAKIGISNVYRFPHSSGKSLAIGINHTSDRKPDYIETWKPIINEFLSYKFNQ